MLPTQAKTYFDLLMSSASAASRNELAKAQQAFERGEFARGQRPDSSRFAAQLSALYVESLETHSRTVVETLKKVHASFDYPLEEEVDAQLHDWGAQALANFYNGLEGAYTRHLQRYGVQAAQAPGLSHTYALAQAAVANLPRQHLWELRNVPARRPRSESTNTEGQVFIHNHGTIGAVQTGAASIANVQQQWSVDEKARLQDAIAEFHSVLQRDREIEPEVRQVLIADLEGASGELLQERPNKGRLLRYLGGVGAVVSTIGSVQPAFEAVRAVARALGLSV